MGWRNIYIENASNIPQSEVTDPDAFANSVFTDMDYINRQYCKATLINQGYICGDEHNGINLWVYNGNTIYVDFKRDSDTELSSWRQYVTNGYRSNYYLGFIAIVNDELQLGMCLFFYWIENNERYWFGRSVNIPSQTLQQHLYLVLTGNEYHQYNWHSVPSIGEHTLSVINDDYINDGEEVTDAPVTNFDSLEESTKLSVLAEGHSSEFPVIESSAGKMTIKDNGNGTCDLRFYLLETPFLKIAGASKNAYLSILQDAENQVAKPSIIYKH